MGDMAAAIDVTRGPAGNATDRHARAARDATALAYLTSHGLDDIAVILGLITTPSKHRPPRKTHRAARRRCTICADEFTPNRPAQRTFLALVMLLEHDMTAAARRMVSALAGPHPGGGV